MLWTILKMDKGGKQTNGPKTRKLRTMLKALYLRDDRLYVSRKVGRITSIEYYIDTSIQGLH